MARKPVISRTMVTTKVTLLVVDTEKSECTNKVVTIPRTYKNNDTIIKMCRAEVETPTTKIVDVVKKEVVETLYAMSEDKFIKYADVYDKDTRKPLRKD